ncbi:hypothetical protein QTP70_009903 [Hemibagrus guttatus]|uniref:Reverse transcriptase RNase H-like domain-containing protein n=1 Tax=Hemibagrus guttatus TaxID=175788 RepID=A0AAE0UHU0_9TELE|nr:hypothetical protein QTP70_009903 [Hemibagrus guttatus]
MTVSEYALQFRTLAAKSGWNEQALLAAYRQGLDPQVRLHLTAYEDAIGLERLIQLSIRVATRMQSCVSEHQGQSMLNTMLDWPDPVSPPEPAPEPMHLGSSHLTPAEWQRRLTQNLCLYCGALGHAIPACPVRPPHPMLRLRTKATSTPYQIQSITGRPVSRRQVSQSAGPVLLQIGVLHVEEITLLVLEESTADVILGRPWLEQHNPILSWETGKVLKWGDTCFPDCFPDLPVPDSPSPTHLPVQATSIESPLANRSLEIPACYAPFSDIFCPKRASKLSSQQVSQQVRSEEAFATLKKAFTSAPLLVHPDPDKPFIVEVDTSTTGVGAVLSQQQGNPSRLHPCAFFSRKLNPAERNYHIGNRELLAVKLTLEECRHWLEGAKHLFLVLTDHKNLEYLRAAKRLNPRQARWTLFFTRFDFTISYRPGSKNTRADALSRLFAPEENPEAPEPILQNE